MDRTAAAVPPLSTAPRRSSYDVLIVGGAVMGSSVAWFLQQSPAMGRGVSELIAYGEYRTLDLTPLGYDRIARNEPFLETAII